MYDEWGTYHTQLPPLRTRNRAKSLVQAVATDSKVATTEHYSNPLLETFDNLTLTRRRTCSVGSSSKQKPVGSNANRYKLFPFSGSELEELLDAFQPIETLNYTDDEFTNAANTGIFLFVNSTKFEARSCSLLLEKSSSLVSMLTDLEESLQVIKQDTEALSKECLDLQNQHTEDARVLDGIDKVCVHFDNLETIARQLNNPGSRFVTKEAEFSRMLRQLDEGLAFLATNQYIRDVDVYQLRFRQCMTRALTLVQSFFSRLLKQILADIQKQSASLNESTKRALYYVKFESESKLLSTLASYVAERCSGNEEYLNMMFEMLKSYFGVRQTLIDPQIQSFMISNIVPADSVVSATRSAVTYFRELQAAEANVFESIFGHDFDSWLTEWLFGRCESINNELRRRIIRETDTTALCEVITLLQEEESLYFKTNLEDAQSRLVFRAQSIIATDVAGYTPSSSDFVLSNRRRKQQDKSDQGEAAVPTEELSRRKNDLLSADSEMFAKWYPPLRKAILILSQIYQLVNSSVFDDLAHGIVHECIQALTRGHDVAVTVIGEQEADLFLLKNLLVLQNHLNEFDIEYVPQEIQVDFSGFYDVLHQVRTQGIELNRGSIVSLAKASVPRVVDNMMDAKEELYSRLRVAVNSFTKEVIKTILQPLAHPRDETAQQDTRELRDQAATELPRIKDLIKSYVEDERTTNILIDSIQDLILQSYQIYFDSITNKGDVMDIDGLEQWLGELVAGLTTKPEDESPEAQG